MVEISRQEQRRILELLREHYPEKIDSRSQPKVDAASLTANVAYLEEHGLVEVNWAQTGGPAFPFRMKITAGGLDFLADDGGLSAILGVVTVRIDDQTLKSLLISQVAELPEPDSVKEKLVEQIKDLPAAAMKELSLSALKAGIRQMPNFLSWLQSMLSP